MPTLRPTFRAASLRATILSRLAGPSRSAKGDRRKASLVSFGSGRNDACNGKSGTNKQANMIQAHCALIEKPDVTDWTPFFSPLRITSALRVKFVSNRPENVAGVAERFKT